MKIENMKQHRKNNKVKTEEVVIEQPIPTAGTTINYVEEITGSRFDLDKKHYGR